MKNDALHKPRRDAAAKHALDPSSGEALDQRAHEAAEAFFKLWQDALRSAASLQDMLHNSSQGDSRDGS